MSRAVVSGRYAGAASRGVAVLIDLAVLLASYSAAVAIIDVLAHSLFGVSVSGANGVAASLILAAWGLIYIAFAVALTGRTVGKAVVGLRVVCRDGSPVRPGAALVRTIVYPLSFLLLGLGVLMVVVERSHRALHDVCAGTVVVYDWGDRPAELPAPLTAYLRDHGSI